MTLAGLYGGLKVAGSILGILITFITFFTLVSKRPRAALRKLIREEADGANKDIKKELESINKRVKGAEETDLAQIRNTITHIYYKYKDEKKIPSYEKQNLMSLYEQYRRLHGNSYVKSIMEQVEKWEELL